MYMNKLEEYIQELKSEISRRNLKDEIEIIRYVYIDLGRKLDFDMEYTLGNNATKNRIYNSCDFNDDKFCEILETHTAICKSISYLLERILGREFGIDIRTEIESEKYISTGRHVYNSVRLKSGETFVLDLEEDLEYIQTGAKTRNFGKIDIYDDKEVMVSEEKLRDIDVNKIRLYTRRILPWGYDLDVENSYCD